MPELRYAKPHMPDQYHLCYNRYAIPICAFCKLAIIQEDLICQINIIYSGNRYGIPICAFCEADYNQGSR